MSTSHCNIKYNGCSNLAVTVTVIGNRRIRACRSCAHMSRTPNAFRGPNLKVTWKAQYFQDIRDEVQFDRPARPYDSDDWEWASQPRPCPWPNEADDPRNEAEKAHFVRLSERGYFYGTANDEITDPDDVGADKHNKVK